jgi:hypothetical protein
MRESRVLPDSASHFSGKAQGSKSAPPPEAGFAGREAHDGKNA